MSHQTSGVDDSDFAPIGVQRFRILSLDGGGIRGTFSAAFLAAMEEMTGRPLVDYFDLITGTSTGGIIALGLGLGLPAAQIRDLYLEEGPGIFKVTGPRLHWPVFRAKHQVKRLQAALDQTFGGHRVGDAKTRLVIPSYDVVSGDVHLFKTCHHPRFKRDYLWLARDVALATSAAPLYFPVFHHCSGLRLVDGGVWANNPMAVAVNEAVGVLECAPDRVEVLSVGTTTEPFHVPRKWQGGGLLTWRLDLARLFLQAQMKGAAGLAHAVTGYHQRLLRIDETTAPGRFSLSKVDDLEDLRALGERAARHAENEVSLRFLDQIAPCFVPYRHPPDTSN